MFLSSFLQWVWHPFSVCFFFILPALLGQSLNISMILMKSCSWSSQKRVFLDFYTFFFLVCRSLLRVCFVIRCCLVVQRKRSVTFTRVGGYQILKGLSIQIQAVQQFQSPRTVSEMEGKIEIFLIGDGNLRNVTFQGLILRRFWKLLEEKRLHLSGTLSPGTTWNHFFACCRRSVQFLNNCFPSLKVKHFHGKLLLKCYIS